MPRRGVVETFQETSLLEELPHAVEDALVILAGLRHKILVGAQLFQHRFFLLGQGLRGPDIDVDDEVADNARVDLREALALQTQNLSALRTRGDLDLGLAGECGNLHGGAERGLRDADVVVEVEVVAVALENLVVGHLEDNEQVAVHAAALRRVPFLRHRHLHAVIDAGGDVDGDDFLARHRAVAVAVRAGVLDDFAGAAAFRADAGLLDDAEHAALLPHHLTAAVAVGAGRDAVVVLGAGAMAVRTDHLLVDFHLLLDGCGHLLQRQFHLDADVAAFAHAPLLAAAATEAAEVEAAEPASEAAAEHIGEVAEDVAEVHAGEVAGLTAHSGVAELVVTRLLVGIAQHIVRLRGLLELLLGFLVAGISVGVVLHGLLAVGLLYLVG